MDNNAAQSVTTLELRRIDVHVRPEGQETLTYLETFNYDNVDPTKK